MERRLVRSRVMPSQALLIWSRLDLSTARLPRTRDALFTTPESCDVWSIATISDKTVFITIILDSCSSAHRFPSVPSSKVKFFA